MQPSSHTPPPGHSEHPPATPEATAQAAVALVRSRAAQSGDAAGGGSAAHRGLELAERIQGLGGDPQLVAAAAVYPLLDAGELALEDVEQRFGEPVVELASGLQRLGAFELPARWQSGQALDGHQAEALRKMLIAIVEDVRLVLVRLADQAYRLRALKDAPAPERERCALETREIFAPLANRLGIWQLKWELEDLSFRYLEPQTYKEIAAWLDERRTDRETYIARVIETLQTALAEAGIEAEVRGRPKHIYSIWRKMIRKQVDFEHIFDVRAVRVLVASTAQCYAALGIAHGMWRYLPREFDDYIASPKDNAYQSLHTAVIGPENRTLEIQIRTHDMHRHAELGVAAHWQYKEGGKDDRAFRAKINWLRQLLEPNEGGETERDFIDRLKSEIFEDRVYVLTPAGDVVDLPAGATPLDFAYHVHTELGHRCRGARINGRIVPLTHELQNGEQVEVITSRTARPSRDWLIPQLGYLASSRARAKARHWFRREEREQNIEQGQAMLDRELQRLNVPNAPHVNDLAKELRQNSATDLFAAIGAGDVTLSDVAVTVQRLTAHREPEPEPTPRIRRRSGRPDRAVEVEGVGDLMTSFAQCCKPVRPDPIIGYLTQGRGITIHRRDCGNVLRLAEGRRDRVLEVSWLADAQQTFPADIRVEAHDRRGLVKDLSTVLTTERVNILAMSTRVDREHLTALVELTVEISGLDELSRILHRLSSVPNVVSARRVK